MSNVDTPYQYAQELLALAGSALSTTVGGEIDRAFVSPGLPALDCCPQLTVHLPAETELSTSPAGPVASGHRGKYGIVATVSFTIMVVRCVPVGTVKGGLPSIAAMEDSAQAHAQDMWAITDAVRKARGAGTLFDGSCSEIFMDGATPLDPAGGCVGWTIRYRASIQGITE